MLDSLTSEKNQIIRALKCLPESVTVPADERVSDLSEIYIAEEVARDIANLNEYWEFIENYQSLSVIAMVGMVNAGKSALGNHLLHQGESETFEEGPIRETAKASEAKLDEQTLLIDLPGLGSVLSEQDDQIVKNIVRRANLLLIVIGINQPITKHLYDFIQSEEVLKNWDAQRVIIVLNKVDTLDGLPESHKRKTIEKYQDFLVNGNSKMGFSGIGKLFDYEIPIVPFSVVSARNGRDIGKENALQNAVSTALTDSSNGCLLRAAQKLIDYTSKYFALVTAYIAIGKKVVELTNSIESSLENMIEDMQVVAQRERTSFFKTIASIKDACFDDMANYQPDFWEDFFKGEEYDSKKTKLNNCKNKYKSKVSKAFDNFAASLKDAWVTIVEGALGKCNSVYLPDKELVDESLKSLIYGIWDVYDDVYFFGYDSDSSRVRTKVKKIDYYLELIVQVIDAWTSQLGEAILEAARQAHQQVIQAKVGEYYSAYNSLEEFCETIAETEVFQQFVSDEESN
jgi:GTP-binding protein EngB required for normal cell division